MNAALVRKYLASLFVAVAAALPVLYVGGVSRGDDDPPCPGEIPINVVCEEFGTAKCDTYDVDPLFPVTCTGKTFKDVANGPFACGKDSTKLNECLQQNDQAGNPVFIDCSKEYSCVTQKTSNGEICVQGFQVGNTKTKVTKVVRKCITHTSIEGGGIGLNP